MKKLTNFSILIMFFSMLLSSLGWAEIIIDNSDPGFQVVGSGYWDTRYNPPWPSYGNDFRFNETGNGADQAVYTFDIPVSGNYEVYAWWLSHTVCSTNTPYLIPFSDGTVTIRVNQQQNPGQWNFLATGFFEQGQYQVIISDDAGGTVVVADAVRIVLVSSYNNAPILEPIGDQSVNEEELLEFTVTASDPDGDNLTYSASNLPSGATFDPATRVFTWTPEQELAGTYIDILFTVTDDGDPPLSDSEAITITVNPPNQPPVLNFIGNKSVHEGETLSFTVSATDPDGDYLTYYVNNLPPGATFDLATQEFNWSLDWQSSGEYKDLVFTVSDGNDFDEESITIDVIDTSPLGAPSGLVAGYSGNSVTLSWEAINAPELAGYNIYRSTSDPGNYEKLNEVPITGTQYTDNNVEPGMIYYYFVTTVDIFDHVELLSEDLNYPFNIAFNNKGEVFVTSWIDGVVYNIEHDGSWSIYASGFGTASSLAFRDEDLFVGDYRDEGHIFRVTPEREVYPYADSLDLDYPTGLAFNANGELFVAEDFNERIFKISEDGESWEVFFEGLDGPGDMVIDDSGDIYVGEDIWDEGIPVGVIDIITPDKSKTIFANLADPDGISFDQAGNLYVGQSHIAEVTKVMPDGSSVPVVIPDGLPWGTGVNKFGELLVVLPWAGQIIKVHLSHETDISQKVDITIPVLPNNAPVLGAIGNKTVLEGELLEFTVTAADPDGDDLTYAVNNLPEGAVFDPVTQVFSWTPNYAQTGTYPDVVFTVTDDGDPSLSDSETIVITVDNVNRPPILEPIGNKTVDEGELLQFTVTASDPDADALTYSASNLPPGAAFDPATQVLSWTPGYN
ncbi:MAG: hypothetical protein GY797_23915, partial [Deltaproteobacteria bacterium]|nr:hypothetical protein [Deltaproteobacteria bacterium]